MNKNFLISISAALVLGFAAVALAQVSVLNYNEQGGARQVIGGTLDVISGGDLDIESGGVFSIAGTTVSATATELNLINGVTATTAEINQAADHSANVEIVIATNVITAAESGATFFLNAATEFVSTLPAPAAGLRYKFIIAAAPSGADYTIVTTSSANIMNISITAITAGDAGELGQSQDVITFVGSGAPGPSIVGDWVECISDATSWFCSGTESIDTGITTGQS